MSKTTFDTAPLPIASLLGCLSSAWRNAPARVAAWIALCLVGFFANSAVAGTLVSFDTSKGAIQVDLFDDVTPQTVANFLNYVNANRYQNTIVHRSFANFVVQGGGYPTQQFLAPLPDFPQHIPIFPSPQNEFHLSNLRGTIAMAKKPNDPNSAQSEWFFNKADNGAPPPNGLDTQNEGFTVFGWIVGTGITVVDAIAALPTTTIQFKFGNIDNVPVDSGNAVNVNNISVVKTHISFQNPLQLLDVNNDNNITPQDALTVINDLIAHGTHAAASQFVGATYTYVDTTGDNQVSPLDALRVINHLIVHGSTPAATPAVFASPMAFTVVPEPSTCVLGITGAAALAVYAWGRWRKPV